MGALSVILGAFGAHYFKKSLSPELLDSYKTGIRYLMLHSIVLLVVNAVDISSKTMLKKVNYLFTIGILFFSGSILAIVLGVPAKLIWFVTPLGGLLLVLGWILLGLGVWRKKDL